MNRQVSATIKQSLRATNTVTDTFFQFIAPILLNQYGILLQRETNPRADYVGVDALMYHCGHMYYADLKTSRRHNEYYHNNIKLELESGRGYNVNERHKGWFVDREKITTVYIFVEWVGEDEAHIDRIWVTIFRRADILRRLTDYGIDAANWRNIVAVTPPKSYDNRTVWPILDGIQITQATYLQEQPINLTLSWQLFADLAILSEEFIRM